MRRNVSVGEMSMRRNAYLVGKAVRVDPRSCVGMYFNPKLVYILLFVLLCINHNCYLYMPSWGPDLVNKLILNSITPANIKSCICAFKASVLL
jgi:hypothetical protein